MWSTIIMKNQLINCIVPTKSLKHLIRFVSCIEIEVENLFQRKTNIIPIMKEVLNKENNKAKIPTYV